VHYPRDALHFRKVDFQIGGIKFWAVTKTEVESNKPEGKAQPRYESRIEEEMYLDWRDKQNLSRKMQNMKEIPTSKEIVRERKKRSNLLKI